MLFYESWTKNILENFNTYEKYSLNLGMFRIMEHFWEDLETHLENQLNKNFALF